MKRVRVYDISLSCRNCGGFFLSTRADAQFCSPKCRVNANRKAALLAKQSLNLQAKLETFARTWAKSGEGNRSDCITELMKIRDQVNSLIYIHER